MANEAKAKIDAAAEKAYAEAATKEGVSTKAVEKAVEADAPKAKAKPAAIKKVVKAPAKKAAAKKAAPKKVAAKKAAPKKVKAAVKKAAKPTNAIAQARDTIMATAKKAQNTDFTKTAKEALADVQTRAKTVFAKTGELASEVTEFNKGNVEAVVK